MNNLKKVGLTALAGSLVVTSAVAGEMSVSGGASIGLKNTTKTSTGKSWTMGNQLTFSGSGELDNGLNVSLSFVLDQGDNAGKTTAADDNGTGPFDSHSVTVSSDSLGSLKFSGEGGSSGGEPRAPRAVPEGVRAGGSRCGAGGSTAAAGAVASPARWRGGGVQESHRVRGTPGPPLLRGPRAASRAHGRLGGGGQRGGGGAEHFSVSGSDWCRWVKRAHRRGLGRGGWDVRRLGP